MARCAKFAAALLVLSWSCALGSCAWLHARRLDLQDCLPFAVGLGGGLTVEAQVTDWVSPGVGFISYSYNAGWLDREVRGFWEESDVVTTPRIAFEVFSEDYAGNTSEQLQTQGLLTALALQSLNLPNERWVRTEDGQLSVEYFALLNFFGEPQAAGVLAGVLRGPDDTFVIRERSVWDRDSIGFGATVAFVHVRAGWSFLQTVDFLAGLVGLDPAGDDPVAPSVRDDPRPRAFPPAPRRKDEDPAFPAERLREIESRKAGRR